MLSLNGANMTLLKNYGNCCFTRIVKQGMIQRRFELATCSFYGKFVFVSGGESVSFGSRPRPTASVERYNIADDLWEIMPAMK